MVLETTLEQELEIMGQVLGGHTVSPEFEKVITQMVNEIYLHRPELEREIYNTKLSITSFEELPNKQALYDCRRRHIMEQYNIPHYVIYNVLYENTVVPTNSFYKFEK